MKSVSYQSTGSEAKVGETGEPAMISAGMEFIIRKLLRSFDHKAKAPFRS